ncbi:SAV_2336 N-terminal domain-related protein [Roseofilum casamattae]|uniref:SAV_2336 N-terminal domain-related protein n=1 Tax=Roseofilum casamattae BLCC-M143 TaxID=3022442 RepID=A0ABT7BZM1_9CYAN|nr:SAV_2336 N-terminal domain-related protein [Roseofilum casamattae]MDJ1184648.1 SAV_2336 N-terminal domain-related protein [Roseofilum casamattae BLCC-M143]
MSSSRAVTGLIDRLQATGLLQTLELRDEDIADSIWLALQMPEVVAQPQQEEEEPAPALTSPEVAEPVAPVKSQRRAEPTVSVTTEESVRQTPQPAAMPGLPFQAPAAPALLNKLALGRALRPLMRKVPSFTPTILDEEATVNRIADRDIWLPVTQPGRERWLDLELVVEESDSAFIWREMVNELQEILETQGAFRNVRVWSLSGARANAGTQSLQLVRRHKQGKPSTRQHSYKELIHPNGRGMILLVSDCTSEIWEQARIHRWLQIWSQQGPLAVVQLFPDWLWNSTQLGLGRKLHATALSPGVPNSRLRLPDLPFWVDIDWPNALVLPVIELEAGQLNHWSQVVSGASQLPVPAFLFELDFVEEQATHPSSYPPERSAEEDADARVSRFLATASFTAQRLAGLMAAAPVSMPVVNLIRTTLLPQARPAHVAEVYMGGLLQRIDSDNREQVYEFYPEVRKLLNQAMGRNETMSVLNAISRYIAERIDSPIRSFQAFMMLLPNLLPQYEEEDQLNIRRFAEIGVSVLQNLGGEYAQFAKEVATNVDVDVPPNVEEDSDSEPQLQEFAFDIATIDVEETVIFTSDVGTLEHIDGNRLVIRKKRTEFTGVIEELPEGIKLELVEIPAGEFTMGSPEDELERYDNEGPQHKVKISSFLMGRYAITQAQWRAIVNNVPTIQRELNPDPSNFKGDNRPVQQVSWQDAVEFCARLSQYTKKRYVLPSEAQWEYACRGGTTTPFHFRETLTTEIANYNGNYAYGEGPKGKCREEPTVVGHFQVTNEFGLYNMHGNVWESCADPWHDNYEGAPEDGSVWDEEHNDDRYYSYNDFLVNLLESDRRRIIRGGSWITIPWGCRSALRNHDDPDSQYNSLGLRVVRLPPI